MDSVWFPASGAERRFKATGMLTGDKKRDRKGRAGRWLIDYPRAIPVGIFMAIAAITALSVFSIENGENRREKGLLREVSQSVASSLDRRGNTSSSYLQAGAALFTTVDDVGPELFRRFVAELRLDSDYRGADGIGWAYAIDRDEVGEFESQIALQTASRYRVDVGESSSQPRLVPVTYLLPETERNRRALGYDMYSEPVRRAAMDEAERAVRPTASGQVVLVQEGAGSSPGFIIYMPVFRNSSQGRELKGFIYSPFNAQVFLESALELSTVRDMGIRLYDGAMAEENLIASRSPDTATGEVLVSEVQIANRQFLLAVESSKADALSPLSMATLLFGLSVAALLMLLARLQARQAREDLDRLAMFEEQNSIRNSLVRELNHRVKNTLANVLSIISLTRRRTDELNEFADGLEGRVRALSATHDLLTKSEWGTTLIGDVIDAEVAPYSTGSDSAVSLSGPAIELAPNDALSLGMAIHELATNAAKYGALSTSAGKVTIDWRMHTDKLAVVNWQESGGPPVSELRETGFGTELIEKIIAHELKHPVELDFPVEGVRCTLHVPVRARGEFQMRQKARLDG